MLSPNLPNNIAALDGERTLLTMFGRNALYLGLNTIKKQLQDKNPKALIPAYNCGDEVGPFKANGFQTSFYDIKPDLNIDLTDLEQRLNNNPADVLLLTHYFGFPQEAIKDIKGMCTQKGVLLVEDCAHAVNTQFNGEDLGSFGDIAIYSLRKAFNIPDGGVLRINNPQIPMPHAITPCIETANKSQKLFDMINTGKFLPGIPVETIYKQLGLTIDTSTGERFVSDGGYLLGIPNSTREQLETIDLKTELEKRRTVFKTLMDTFSHLTGNLFSHHQINLTENLNPSFFPLIVNDSTSFMKFLRDKGINIGNAFWTSYNKDIPWEDFPKTAKLKRSVFIIALKRSIEIMERNNLLGALNEYQS